MLPFMMAPPPPATVIASPDPVREATIAVVAIIVGALLVLALGPQMQHDHSAPRSAAALELPPSKPSSSKMLSGVSASALQTLLESRRSVQPKNYTGLVLPDAVVRSILEAAPWSPNHGKTEPWRFVVFSGAGKQKLLDMTLRWYEARPTSFWQENFVLATTGKPEFADAQDFANYYAEAAVSKWGKASHLVAICVKRQRPVAGKKLFPEWEEDAAVACAVQNMHLLATTKRVGAYWSSWYAQYRGSPDCARDLGLDPDLGDRCLGVFVIGEVHDAVLAANRATRLPIDEVTSWVH
mmetsp:Transcript_44075/g.115836  ORF Transcript_44075/g.115836 Transcript_44075/m.115836 type:complete len:296 (-) Transcript_44075:320-1207(-)